MNFDQFRNIKHILLSENYHPFIFPEDEEIAKAHPCLKCGSTNMRGEGLRRPYHYRAFAICDDCGNVSEF